MNYDEAIAYIAQAGSRGILPGLDRMEGLLEKTGHPERACKVIHVAGTNGKGSVCTYIAAILQAAGYRVGRYVSPTIYDYRERIQINGRFIGCGELADWMAVVKTADEECQSRGTAGASAFELETALAFLYFRAMACDFVVLETGMGGLADATNVVEKPLVSVITAIGMDHMGFLGDSIEAIALQKGGIIKLGCPVVLNGDNAAAKEVLLNICRRQKYTWRVVYARDAAGSEASLEEGQYFDYAHHKGLHTWLLGSYQPANAALAIETVQMLADMGLDGLNDSAIEKGIEEARWPGRFEVVSRRHLIIVDVAHNPDGVRALCDSVRLYLKDRRVILLMGVFKDKDYGQMLRLASELSDTLITYKPCQERGLDAEALARAARECSRTGEGEQMSCFHYVEAAVSQEAALERALSLGGPEAAILSFGSLSTVAGLDRAVRRLVDGKD